MLRIYISIRRDGRWVRANRRGIAWSSTNICFQSHKYSTWFIRWDFWHCLEWGNALDDRLGHEWKWYFYHTYFCRTKFTIPMVKGKSWVNWRVMIQYLYHPTWFTGPYHDVYDNWHSTILNQTGITRFKGGWSFCKRYIFWNSNCVIFVYNIRANNRFPCSNVCIRLIAYNKRIMSNVFSILRHWQKPLNDSNW